MKRTRPYPRNAAFRSHLVALLVCLASTGCDLFYTTALPDPEEPGLADLVTGPALSLLKAHPATAGTNRFAKFMMRVRLWDKHGHVLPDAHATGVQWVQGANLNSPNPVAGKATTEISSNTTALFPPPSVVVARADSKSDQATITIVSGAPADGRDWIRAPHSAGESPMLALVNGTSSATRTDTVIAFAQEGPLDHFQGPAGDVTVFSRLHAILRVSAAWTTGTDLIDLDPATASGGPGSSIVASTTLRPRVVVPVIVWNLDTAVNSFGRIVQDIEYAKIVLSDSRTGIDLSVTYGSGFASDVVLDLSPLCPAVGAPNNVREQLEAAGVIGFAPGTITIAYAQETTLPGDDYPPTVSGYNGVACPWNGTDGAIIVMSGRGGHATTLVHEFGHVLGPPPPVIDHINVKGDGLDESNLLWPYHEVVPLPRGLLSLGQAFRFGLGKDSFLDSARLIGGSAVPCDPDPTRDRPCPRLSKDVRDP